jgi:hypothetical protein
MGKLIILLFAILSANSGCTVLNTYRFRVQDAADGQPISGVQAEGNNDCYVPGDYGLPTLTHTQHRFALSNPQGLVRFDGGGQHEVTFSREGYEPCTVVASSPGYKVRGNLFSRKTCAWEDERTAVIQMQPLKSKQEELREEDKDNSATSGPKEDEKPGV